MLPHKYFYPKVLYGRSDSQQCLKIAHFPSEFGQLSSSALSTKKDWEKGEKRIQFRSQRCLLSDGTDIICITFHHSIKD